MSKRLALVFAGTFAALYLARGILYFDPPSYCHFADTETFLGVPNFWNVVTNVGFVAVGAWGLARARRYAAGIRALALLFAAAIVGTGFGSAYFHWETTPPRLFWDQVPMSVGFGSFIGIVVADRLRAGAGKFAGFALAVLGPLSVWNIYYGNGEPAYYLALQFGSLIFATLVLLAYPAGALRRAWVFTGIGCYVFAKLLELKDAAIYAGTGCMSGHALKHVAATAAVYAILKAIPVRPTDRAV